MREVTIHRIESDDEGTFGTLVTDSEWHCVTGELPNRDNASGKSCIPTGKYEVTWRESPKHGMCYHVEQVPDRSDIEMHAANWMGDAEKGLVCELEGCIALGKSICVMEGQKGITSSKMTMAEFEYAMRQEDFTLTIA